MFLGILCEILRNFCNFGTQTPPPPSPYATPHFGFRFPLQASKNPSAAQLRD